MRYLYYVIFIFFTAHLILVLLFLKSYVNRLKDIAASDWLDTLMHFSGMEITRFDVGVWQQLEKKILEENFGLLHSVLVVCDNKLVIEEYYNKWQKKSIHDIQSATKSIISALIGIAIDKGFIKSVSQRMASLFPAFPFDSADTLKKDIRLKDMLTMSAGIEWNEQTKNYNEAGNSLTDMYSLKKNWIEHILQLPVANKPGTKFNYNSGISILLGAIIAESSKMSVAKFAEKYLFEPLGIQKYQWAEYLGVAHGGGGLYLTSMDLAKIGILYYNDGMLAGKQIISKKWIKESLTQKSWAGNNTSYGYHWWIMDSVFDFKPIPYAAGNGWQFIFIIKEFNMVIVTTGHNYVHEEPKTTIGHNELLYSILSCNPQFQKRIKRVYEQHLNIEPANLHEVLVLAYCLNTQGEYRKTITYLKKVEDKCGSEFRFNFLFGEAYYHTGNAKNAKLHLNKCIEICDSQNFPKAGYYQMASNIMKKMDEQEFETFNEKL